MLRGKFDSTNQKYYPDPGSDAVMRHRYGISALVFQASFGGETSSGVAKCRLFSQSNLGRTYEFFSCSGDDWLTSL